VFIISSLFSAFLNNRYNIFVIKLDELKLKRYFKAEVGSFSFHLPLRMNDFKIKPSSGIHGIIGNKS